MEAKRYQGKSLLYLTVHPDGYNPEMDYPMIILLHGFGANMMDLAGLSPAIDREGYIYACPNAPLPFQIGPGTVGYGWMTPPRLVSEYDLQARIGLKEEGKQAVELLETAARRAAELGVRVLQTYVASCDQDQEALVQEAGYSLEARLRDRLRDGDRWVDMLVYSLTLPGDAAPLRGRGDYYGGRKPWQAQRVAESGGAGR